ncbi:protein nanos-like isoform X2 [Cydia pomonella]|uniref:protein nanos-like isoform X2 n=1 Tax=Cydia pomonella TaxID=82600 RepID=UPI002ADDC11C|nr:protein nanos-like isoform X2 [Cydia pomonella]
MEKNVFSDYGTGSGSSARSSWASLDSWPSAALKQTQLGIADKQRQYQSADLLDLMVQRSTLQEMMSEFKMNGYDSPYNPDEDKRSNPPGDHIGMGPSSVYLRQKSWPEPEATPVQRLPRPRSEWIHSTTTPDLIKPPIFFNDDVGKAPSNWYLREKWSEQEMMTSQQVPRPKSEWIKSTTAPDITQANKFFDDLDLALPVKQLETISAEQVRVLNSLPNAVLYGLLRDLEQKRNETARNKRVPDECRFCKNNGERESYYRSHVLKDSGGRVTCPVLRKFVCKRCGARGDHAHTVKYCPLSTEEERVKSTAMMRSVRLASGRRRGQMEPAGDYVMFGETTPSFLRDYRSCAPLDPVWAELEQKLTL